MGRNTGINIKKIITASVILIAIFISASVYVVNTEIPDNAEDVFSAASSPFKLAFIDVGQGDCSLIMCEGVNILIDSGETPYAGTVETYLKKSGVDKIDCFILSHPHTDHIGSSSRIIKDIPVENVIMTSFSEDNIPTTKSYENLIDSLLESSAHVSTVSTGDEFNFGNLHLKILSPAVETDDYNDMSVVVKADYKDISVLFTGDASSEIESQILESGQDVKSDILKVSHHGSYSASSAAFIKAVSPDFAFIPCGENNRYGHPHKETLDTFDKTDIKLFRADYDGTVVFLSDGTSIMQGAA